MVGTSNESVPEIAIGHWLVPFPPYADYAALRGRRPGVLSRLAWHMDRAIALDLMAGHNRSLNRSHRNQYDTASKSSEVYQVQYVQYKNHNHA